MKIALVDLGTNTFNLLLGEIKNDTIRILDKKIFVVRIGEESLRNRFFSEKIKEKILKTMATIFEITKKSSVDTSYCIATSAFRTCTNSDDIVNAIQSNWGCEIKILSGKEEAHFIAKGVMNAMGNEKAPYIIMDIGGGSIEFISIKNKEIIWSKSFNLGVQRIMDKFKTCDPLSKSDIDTIHNHLDENLDLLFNHHRNIKSKIVVGASGMFDTLFAIYSQNPTTSDCHDLILSTIPLDFYQNIHTEFISKNHKEREAIKGMASFRVEMIPIASVVLLYVVQRLKITQLLHTSYALNEGIFFNLEEFRALLAK